MAKAKNTTKGTKKETKKDTLENMLFYGYITNTSNKISEDFKSEVPTKACYIHVEDEAVIEALEDFGVHFYTSEKDNNRFGVVRASKKIALYLVGQAEKLEDYEGRICDDNGEIIPNFRTTDKKLLRMNLIKGHKLGNDFIRLQSIELEDATDIVEIMPRNPFLDLD